MRVNNYIVLMITIVLFVSFWEIIVLNLFLKQSYLLYPLLVFHSLPFEVLTRLPGLSQLGLIEVAPASGGCQVFLQLPDAHLHLLQLSMVLLRTQRARHSHDKERSPAIPELA